MGRKKNKKEEILVEQELIENIVEQPIEEPIIEEAPVIEEIAEPIKEEVKEDLPRHFMTLANNFDHRLVYGEEVDFKGHKCIVSRIKLNKVFLRLK